MFGKYYDDDDDDDDDVMLMLYGRTRALCAVQRERYYHVAKNVARINRVPLNRVTIVLNHTSEQRARIHIRIISNKFYHARNFHAFASSTPLAVS